MRGRYPAALLGAFADMMQTAPDDVQYGLRTESIHESNHQRSSGSVAIQVLRACDTTLLAADRKEWMTGLSLVRLYAKASW